MGNYLEGHKPVSLIDLWGEEGVCVKRNKRRKRDRTQSRKEMTNEMANIC